jgi:transcriptional antiterminator
MTSYKIVKPITNNIIRALDINDHEVILIGKGIGFNRKKNDVISSTSVENIFTLLDTKEQSLYTNLIKTTSPKLIELANDMIIYIQSQVEKPLNEHIHVALTDHIAFLVRRCKMGIPIANPFSLETSTLYPKETRIAAEVVQRLSDELNLQIPSGEIGFITLHIITALSEQTLEKIQRESYLVTKLIAIIENQAKEPLDHESLNYTRLVTHIRFIIERVQRDEILDAPDELVDSIRKAYPECYSLAFKLIKSLQQELNKTIAMSEVFYLSLHLYRFIHTERGCRFND